MDARDLLVSSDYPIDMVIYRSPVVSITVPSSQIVDRNIPHNIGQSFLPIGEFSTSSNFQSNVYPINAGPQDGGVDLYSNSLYIDESNAKISVYNWTSSTITLYFRYIGLPRSDLTYTSVESTSTYQNLNINTDLNYMKLYRAGVTNIPANQSRTVGHNLGYMPTVLSWTDSPNFGMAQTSYISTQISAPAERPIIAVRNDSIVMAAGLFSDDTVHWRIYVD